MISTFPAKNSVRAFFQEIILSGSYEAFKSRVAFIFMRLFKLSEDLSRAFPRETLVIIGFYESVTIAGCFTRKRLSDAFSVRWAPALSLSAEASIVRTCR